MITFIIMLFQKCKEDLQSGNAMSNLNRAVAYYYVSFGAYRGRMDNPLFMISTSADTNRADTYKKMCSGFCNYLSGYRMWRF